MLRSFLHRVTWEKIENLRGHINFFVTGAWPLPPYPVLRADIPVPPCLWIHACKRKLMLFRSWWFQGLVLTGIWVIGHEVRAFHIHEGHGLLVDIVRSSLVLHISAFFMISLVASVVNSGRWQCIHDLYVSHPAVDEVTYYKDKCALNLFLDVLMAHSEVLAAKPEPLGLPDCSTSWRWSSASSTKRDMYSGCCDIFCQVRLKANISFRRLRFCAQEGTPVVPNIGRISRSSSDDRGRVHHPHLSALYSEVKDVEPGAEHTFNICGGDREAMSAKQMVCLGYVFSGNTMIYLLVTNNSNHGFQNISEDARKLYLRETKYTHK